MNDEAIKLLLPSYDQVEDEWIRPYLVELLAARKVIEAARFADKARVATVALTAALDAYDEAIR